MLRMTTSLLSYIIHVQCEGYEPTKMALAVDALFLQQYCYTNIMLRTTAERLLIASSD